VIDVEARQAETEREDRLVGERKANDDCPPTAPFQVLEEADERGEQEEIVGIVGLRLRVPGSRGHKEVQQDRAV
jgi:hypothetical protein